jgi:hypothetical protein
VILRGDFDTRRRATPMIPTDKIILLSLIQLGYPDSALFSFTLFDDDSE